MQGAHTRRSVLELTEADLDRYPLWEYALDEEGIGGQDETFVRPVMLLEDSIPHIERVEWFLVTADFATSGTRKYAGLAELTIGPGKRVKVSGYALLGDFGFAPLPQVSRAVAKKKKLEAPLVLREELCHKLEVEERVLFPMTFRLRLSVEGEDQPRSGKVH